MSAIAGILYDDDQPVPAEDGAKLMQALQRYPADDAQAWHGGSVFLGCHAQWITPESVHERLPYYDDRSRLAITADAIIDNRAELFDRLQIDYARRKGMTDSELIVAAYLKWGKEAPRYLIGDYAFVIWDERKRLLFGARDLLGNRTLYYQRQERRFAFCTVIDPLFELSGAKKAVNESWFSEFLAIPVILDAVDVNATVYRDIGQLPPAHWLAVEEGKLTIGQYDKIEAPREPLRLKSNGEYEEAFRDVFREAVSSRLRTFRRVGASLSGGLDSGAVASFAADSLRREGKTLHTYSYVPSTDFVDWTPRRMVADESPYIQATVRHVGNIAHNGLDFGGRDSFGEIDDLIGLLEAPYKFFENSFWIKGILERAQQDGVSVLLTGARGNYTISWGPAMDYYAQLLRKLRWVRFCRELKHYGQRMNIGRSRLLPILGKQAFPFAAKSANAANPAGETPQVIHPDFAARTGVFEKLRRHDVGLDGCVFDEFEARDYQFGNLATSNHQGTSVTKFSLRYGVWERDPTADPRVVRFCLSVPIEQYVQNGMDRSLVRRATASYLPDDVRLNQRVRGVQGADWIHRMLPAWSCFTEELRKLCRDPAAAQYLNVNQIKASLEKIGPSPKPAFAYDTDARLLMRALIAWRFLRQLA
ncbi:asparagine synthase-related protein [Paenibacillus sacheonensis]|uniref:asparagine synthase (glutamine-hydrolyzing) n=1 Tax=Paenibacillus sacheonensis TaxID=742054 RepID=A0A7X4YRA7_9BACL|nr:asparagine synthase-related protein [Paenibacillus sacheonensis]MBM7563593.1 asparagine synthase (glutamine-hydrolyzing) [Paenibacillus sacheonensis]NBC71111.1 asparagine synthetase B [Paenibacillus sacheonensis]